MPLLDKYETTGLSYFFDVWIIVFGLFYFASLALVLNYSTVHRMQPVTGIIYSLRYTSLEWVLSFLGPMRLLFGAAVMLMVIFRKQRGCISFWFAVLLAFFILDIFVLAGWGMFYSNCNKQGEVDNPCNDPLWCCYQPIYSVSGNACTNTVPCTPVVTTLSPNVDFLWMFYTNLGFVVLEAIVTFTVIYMWVYQTTKRTRHQQTDFKKLDEEKQEEEEEEEEVGEKVVLPQKNSESSIKSTIQRRLQQSIVIQHQPTKMTKPE